MEDSLRELVHNYKPSEDTIKIVQQTPVVLLVGVSGAGKDTIKNALLESGKYHHIVSHTTRAPRINGEHMEQDGVEYHFVSKEAAAEMLRRGEFVEAKEYSHNLYGTSAKELQDAQQEGKIAITDIEVQRVTEYKAISDNVIAQFILPPNYDEWQRRLHARYGKRGADQQDIDHRMQTAINELKEALAKPYYHFVVNDSLAEVIHAVDSIAHNKDSFTRIDDSYRVWAEKLLAELERASGTH